MRFTSEQPPVPMQYDAQYLEGQLRELRAMIYLIRQFLEPAIYNNKNMPDQIIDPLE